MNPKKKTTEDFGLLRAIESTIRVFRFLLLMPDRELAPHPFAYWLRNVIIMRHEATMRRAALGFFLVVAFLTGARQATASPVGVSYTVSGSAGDWTLNFSVANNVTAGQSVYFFGVLLPAQDIVGSPDGAVNNARTFGGVTTTIWNPNLDGNGGPDLTFNNLWRDFMPGGVLGISFGSSLSGFEVTVNTLTAPSSVQWFAYSNDFSPDGSFPYLGGGQFLYGPESFCESNGFTSCLQEEEENPGFAGTAFETGATPEPSTLLLLASGLLGLGPFVRRHIG